MPPIVSARRWCRTGEAVLRSSFTKDEDIPELAILRGAPPKVVWLRLGNCKTAAVEKLIRRNVLRIQQLADDDERVILELFGDD